LLGVALLIWMLGPLRRPSEPWSAIAVVVSNAAFMVVSGGWAVLGGWIVLGAAVAATARFQPLRLGRGRPDAADLVAVVGWAAAFALRPELLEIANGGWLAPAILLLAARRSAYAAHLPAPLTALDPVPPSRVARGTLSLRGVVLGENELPRSVPIDLELRAGDSLAVLCDGPVDAEVFSQVLAGRTKPLAGEVAIDAVPLEVEDRLVAVVGPGERFLRGGIEVNLAALCEDEPNPTTVAAVGEACSLGEVTQSLGDRMLDASGAPLSGHHRLLLLAARVIPSRYRVVVVADPVSWLNAVQGELWRAAVVRASVGRTAVWITTDRDLASRASQIMELRHGALRPFVGFCDSSE
jgi:predicted ABC-type transport system involved in lysophospholipase L1 biosynthesis ATPase subunit